MVTAPVLGQLLFAEREVLIARVRRVAAEDGLPALPSPPAPPPGDPTDMLDEWTTARVGNLRWLRTDTSEQRAHASVHPRQGRVTLEECSLRTLAGPGGVGRTRRL